MKMIWLIFCFLLIFPALLYAQPNLDAWIFNGFSPYTAPDGIRIYFDDSVLCGYGGPLNDPHFFTTTTVPEVQVYLVVTEPSATAIAGWHCDFEMVGDFTLDGFQVLGGGATVVADENTLWVEYDVPLQVTDNVAVLAEWSITMVPYPGIVLFYIRPPVGSAYDSPGYSLPNGEVIDTATINSNYYGHFDFPCMELNGAVSTRAEKTWGGVKALFR